MDRPVRGNRHGQAEREELEARGFSVHAYVPDNAYLVRGTDMAALADLPGVVWTSPLHTGYRMTPDLLTELDAAGEPQRMRLLLLEPVERGRVTRNALIAAGAALSEAAASPRRPAYLFLRRPRGRPGGGPHGRLSTGWSWYAPISSLSMMSRGGLSKAVRSDGERRSINQSGITGSRPGRGLDG